ncbi:hypothetical protein AP75_01860 [Kaistella haifensis DSM 19056]|uniref:Uncharacterized protein n=1 Tax=Kaistella haifensis DSM 19056 TaxID=1450526 RepID=A0A246BC70_9FLAO|nr:hypothetical protein [Kaistella haifensis]OWK99256.1 hypothetical protein AP75_01860 [Kaistella haifensis DSM 19056]
MMNDFLLDKNNDLQISDGDFVVGESTYQHQKHLLMAEKGQYKQNPTIGVASKNYVERESPDEYARAIRQEFIRDGMKVHTLVITADLELSIDAEYN